MERITFPILKDAVAGSIAAVRVVTTLEPAGGSNDKLFPPTYMKEGRAETKYAFEDRRVGDKITKAVLLDSVASQANRMEEALLEAWRRNELAFPVVQVDFSKEQGLEDLEKISALQAPHRIADALLRDSTLEGKPFRQTKVGTAFTESTARNATGMYQYCPTALLFGIWDSTGPKGGLGAKFQRCIVSEIVGVDAIFGAKTASRMDPTLIERKAGPIYQHKDPTQVWTVLREEAVTDDKGKPILYGDKKEKGLPSAVNHGNIPPSIDLEAGGVTIDHAMQTVVLTLAGLRRLRFRTNHEGVALADDKRDAAELAARTSLAALGLAAIVAQREVGYDLRSRCVLVPKDPLTFHFLPNDGSASKPMTLDREDAMKLVAEAQAEAKKHGLGWDRGPLTLTPAPKLAQLIRQSRDLARVRTDETEDV